MAHTPARIQGEHGAPKDDLGSAPEEAKPPTWATTGPGGPETTNAVRHAYLEWAEATELQLQGLTFDAGVTGALHTARYWRIRMLHDDPRPFALVDAEVRQQVAWLQTLLDDLNDRLARASGRGHLTVLDSNVVLHFLPLDQIPWTEVINRTLVRLIPPLRVIEELDAKKYARRDELAGRGTSCRESRPSLVVLGDPACSARM